MGMQSDFYGLPAPSVIAFLCGMAAGMLLSAVPVFVFLMRQKRLSDENKALREAGKTAADAEKDRMWLLSRVSHELRTPLHTMLGLTKLMQDETELSALQKDIGQLQETENYLLSLVNDILDADCAESGNLTLHPRPTVFGDVVRSVLAGAELMTKEKGIRFEIGEHPEPSGEWLPVMVDAARLQQVFLNLISNAVKYTPAGGTVTVGMHCVSRRGDILTDCFWIRDTGIGIDPLFLPHIFEPFAQEGRMNTGRNRGTGLGLCIVKQILTLMGGDISIDSRPNEGTEVRVTVSYHAYRNPRSEAAETEDDGLFCGKRILVAEDVPINAQIIQRLLQKWGAVGELAFDGEQGAEMFRLSEPGYYSAVLADICMPKMNGCEMTRAIRSMDRSDATGLPIIAMTADGRQEDVRCCIASGMSAHITKPICEETLKNTLSKLL